MTYEKFLPQSRGGTGFTRSTTISSVTTLTANQAGVIEVDGSSGSFDITLPLKSSLGASPGLFYFRRVDGNGSGIGGGAINNNNIQILAQGSDELGQITGSHGYQLLQGENVLIFGDQNGGSSWTVMGQSLYNINADGGRLLGSFDDINNSDSPATLSRSSTSFIRVDASGGAVTINMPEIHPFRMNKMFFIEKYDSSANIVTLTAAGGDVFLNQGAFPTSITLTTQGESVLLMGRDDSWYVINRFTLHPTFSSVTSTGNISTSVAGAGLRIKEGSNSRLGESVLVGGTVTVSNTSITANTKIFLSRRVAGGVLGNLTYTRSAGASFTIDSDNVADTSTVSWHLIEPA